MTDQDRRQAVIDAYGFLVAQGLVHGTSGNISLRFDAAMAITPSGIPVEVLRPDQIVEMPLDFDGDPTGSPKPSSEWRFHRDILAARPDVQAVVHTHSPYATAISMTRQSIPAAHYMVAAFGGADVRCSDYALFGSQALSDTALSALNDRWACLLANHGAIALGETLDKALWRAAELEALARQYVISLQAGGPALLSDAEIADALEAFKDYGPKA